MSTHDETSLLASIIRDYLSRAQNRHLRSIDHLCQFLFIVLPILHLSGPSLSPSGKARISHFTSPADNACFVYSTYRICSTAIFELISAIIIFVMGITMLKLDRAKAKWRVKLQHAFEGKYVDGRTRTGKWVLFLLPFITVLREGLEAVVFVGGVTLGQSATSIPIAAIVGIIVGLICGFLVYAFASRSIAQYWHSKRTPLITCMSSPPLSYFPPIKPIHPLARRLGKDVGDAGGDGPGSFDVRNSVWHLDCCNPMNNSDNGGWDIFNVLFGWTNSATIGSVLSYVFYWIAVIGVLVFLKFREGRFRVGKWESDVGKQRRERREAAAATSLQ
ncbi:hypothetical protein EW146_g8815 [Bondarzewia mesenterica]|uniref:Uncharacterized protein n=1 Tax=Bondarzewia mesenterica TaxID=1095465 RepID=A0A4S4LBC3_9AGAM|nr:hypothetical protein EW146_g8815 [Bondarzewia mesenterica]